MGIIIDTKAEELSNDSPKVDSDSGDLISRCELFNRLANVQTLADAYAVIQGMSTIEPERKKGKWIYKDDLKQYFCSECGYPSLTYDDVYIYSMDLPNFCEECGADMRLCKGGEFTDEMVSRQNTIRRWYCDL